MGMTLDLAAVFLPLAGFLIAGLGGHKLGDKASQAVTCLCVCVAALLSVLIFNDVALNGHPRTHELAPWIAGGGLDVSWAVRLDTLSAIMLLVVN
ncbi:MAG: NADH-quinone oxidoreductase subunit L, partial [Bdellovibrionales bacterium]